MPCKRTAALLTAAMLCCRAAALAGYFGGVSNIVQHQMSDMFEDTDWLLGFISENSKRLGAAYEAIAGLHTVSMIVILHRDCCKVFMLEDVTAAPCMAWQHNSWLLCVISVADQYLRTQQVRSRQPASRSTRRTAP